MFCLPNFLVIIMILKNSSPSHSNLIAFFCYISMCSIFFFSFWSSHKSSQSKHSQGYFATIQQWKLLSLHLWSGQQITKWLDTVYSLFYHKLSLHHVEIFPFKWHEAVHISLSTFHIQQHIFTGFYKVESRDKCLRALSADSEMNFPSPSPADVQHPEWWSDSINRDRNFSFTVS